MTDLLKHARKLNAQLGADLEAEFRALSKRRTFGLVFERHQPEAVELPGRPIRRGDRVRILPQRGETRRGDSRLWRVIGFDGEGLGRTARLRLADNTSAETPETQRAPIQDLVPVAEFRDTIYPGLVETGRVERGGDKPYHAVINAENFHALELLTYTHRHRVDAIYIDPPYNSGARDWKYNNDYVEADDDYRHSKWLAMMERRLKIARELLNPDDSVLIVTIDEKEYMRLGLLLEQTLPEARIQMISSVINPSGAKRDDLFSRSDEYIFFAIFGEAQVRHPMGDGTPREVRWWYLRRTDITSRRGTVKGGTSQFYPVYVSPESGRIVAAGEALTPDDPIEDAPEKPGSVAVFPIREDGVHMNWGLTARSLMRLNQAGLVRVTSGHLHQPYIFTYLSASALRKIEAGDWAVAGERADGSKVVVATQGKVTRATTAWRYSGHDAGQYGTSLLRALLPSRRFPYPKALYAVEDALRFFVKDKPNAVVIDFFAGSGTTAHAVMRLNRQDGGRRQSIMVTNNEVAADEQKALREKGLRPGDPEWEHWGICDHITKPRIEAAITGRTPNGEPIKGEYRFTDEFPMGEGLEENAAFFTLTYEAPLSVAHHKTFKRIAPLLWLRAGSRGRMIDDLGGRGWDVADTYAVLENLDNAADFIGAVALAEVVQLAFIVTDDDSAFQLICRELPAHLSPIRLYESYLYNFRINSGRSD